jgi:AraC-like DNA-binding protein/mannose-6-phosphate isomerase-like protein (cupin superfamily)
MTHSLPPRPLTPQTTRDQMVRVRNRRLFYEPIHAQVGHSFYYKSFGPNSHFQFNWHHHPELEVALVTHGRGRRYVGDAIEDFVPGDFVLLGADLPHTWHSEPENGTVASKVIQFLPEVFGGLLGEAPELRPLLTLLRRADRGLRVFGRTRDECERLFLRIVEDNGQTWRQVTDLIALLGTIAESAEVAEISTAAPRGEADAQTGRKVDRVFALLHRDPDEIPSQAEAARALKMSPAAFSRFFKHAVGKTYVGCVNEIRVLAACRELIETERTIIDIALGAGFDNLSNFNRRFKALKGQTPSTFRARARKDEDG